MKKPLAGIINISINNILSIKRAFERWNAEVDITDKKEKILSASRLVLPGVGAFDKGMDNLKKKNFVEEIDNSIKKGRFILGICLGMQLLFENVWHTG